MKQKAAEPARHELTTSPPVDQVGITERANRFMTRSIKDESKREGLLRVLNTVAD